MDATSLRRGLDFFRNTPFHPQWFVLRGRDRRLGHLSRVSGDVLDIGCTDKALANHLPRGCRYVGLDYYATVKNFYDTRPDVYGDACKLPFADASLDAVLFFEVLEHVRDAQAAVSEVSRVLKPGGILLMSMPFMYPIHNAPFDFQRFTRHGLEWVLAEHGLAAERVEARLHSM